MNPLPVEPPTVVDRPDPADRISVIVPTIDEAENIDHLIGAILEHGRAAALDIEVLIVDDGSRDGTRERVRAWEQHHPVKLLPRDGEKGLATAVLAGAALASGGIVVVMDADLSHPPEKIPELVRPILQGTSDLVIGSRYVPGGSTPDWPLIRRLVSRTAAALPRVLTDVHDPLSGFFAIRRERLLETGKGARGFKILLEVILRAGEELRVQEVPIAFQDRAHGRSKLGPAVMGTFLRQLAGLAGGAVSAGSAAGFALSGGLAVVTDFLLFHLLLRLGLHLGEAQLGSFLAASAVFYGFLAFRPALAGESWRRTLRTWSGSLSFAMVAILAVLLRGGILGLLEEAWGSTAAMVPALLTGWLVSSIGVAFFAISPPLALRDPARQWRLAAVGLLAYLLLLRMVFLGQVELLPEESYYWNYSVHLDIGYLDHPPMVAWIIWLGTQVFGDTEFGIRIGGVACWLAATTFAYLLARDLLGRSAAFRAALLMAVLPFFFGIGFFTTPDTPLTAFWAGTLYFLERALLRERRMAWLGAGICLGLGLLSKYSIALLGPAALAFLLLDGRSRRWLLRPEPYGALLLAMILFLPVIIWNAEHNWASFFFQGPKRWSQAPRFALPMLLGSVLIIITPFGFLGFILGSSGRPAKEGARRSSGAGILDGRGRLFIILFTLLPVSAFAISSLRNQTKINWTGPIWLAALPAMALTMNGGRTFLGRWLEWSWKPAILAMVLGYGAGLDINVLGRELLGALPPSYFSMGWKDLGLQVENLEQEVLQKTGEEPLIVGMDKYHISSQMAFYDPNHDGPQETAATHLLGKKSLMYEYWFPPKLQEGKSIIFVGRDPEDLDSPSVRDHMERLEPIRDLSVKRNGTVVDLYHARVGHGYRSTMP